MRNKKKYIKKLEKREITTNEYALQNPFSMWLFLYDKIIVHVFLFLLFFMVLSKSTYMKKNWLKLFIPSSWCTICVWSNKPFFCIIFIRFHFVCCSFIWIQHLYIMSMQFVSVIVLCIVHAKNCPKKIQFLCVIHLLLSLLFVWKAFQAFDENQKWATNSFCWFCAFNAFAFIEKLSFV